MAFPYKVCDPVHGFIRFDQTEQQLIDSPAFQRLRYLHQMGVAYLLYPGATHTRFEHSLGVMELASQIYDTLVSSDSLKPIDVAEDQIVYWRRILRLAALCHDLGHLPFSHTAEPLLLPDGGHESKTFELIQHSALETLWEQVGPNAKNDITKLAVDEGVLVQFAPHLKLSDWEKLLCQIITEDNFGADRIDYLIRDAYYTGVGYGHFDYHQLIDSLRVFPEGLGVLSSGMQSVESLWIARYMMYARVYQHPKTRIYSQHMLRMMGDYYSENGFPADLSSYIREVDYTILSALHDWADRGHMDALVLLKQKPPYILVSMGEENNLSQLDTLKEQFGKSVIIDPGISKKGSRKFPVWTEKELIISSSEASPFLGNIPIGGGGVGIYVDPTLERPIREWLGQNR